MRTAIWIGAAALLVILIVVATRSGYEDRTPARPGAGAPGIDGSADAQSQPEGQGAITIHGDMLLSEPDRALAAGEAEVDDAPPRTVAGLPAVRKSVKLPVVDPADLPHDPKVGRVEVNAVVRQSAVADEIADPAIVPGPHIIETSDGPLAGVIPTPDSGVPGPAGIAVSGSTGDPTPAEEEPVVDPQGPGIPANAADADAMPPMFVVPGDDDAVVEDPDSSTTTP